MSSRISEVKVQECEHGHASGCKACADEMTAHEWDAVSASSVPDVPTWKDGRDSYAMLHADPFLPVGYRD